MNCGAVEAEHSGGGAGAQKQSGGEQIEELLHISDDFVLVIRWGVGVAKNVTKWSRLEIFFGCSIKF